MRAEPRVCAARVVFLSMNVLLELARVADPSFVTFLFSSHQESTPDRQRVEPQVWLHEQHQAVIDARCRREILATTWPFPAAWVELRQRGAQRRGAKFFSLIAPQLRSVADRVLPERPERHRRLFDARCRRRMPITTCSVWGTRSSRNTTWEKRARGSSFGASITRFAAAAIVTVSGTSRWPRRCAQSPAFVLLVSCFYQ
jgi:hypothetical protein